MTSAKPNTPVIHDAPTAAVAAGRGLDSLHRAVQARRLYGDDHAAFRAFRDDAVVALSIFAAAPNCGPIVAADDRFIFDGDWIESDNALRELAGLLREFDVAAVEITRAPKADEVEALTALLAAVGAHRLTGTDLAGEVLTRTHGSIAVIPVTLAPPLSSPEPGDAVRGTGQALRPVRLRTHGAAPRGRFEDMHPDRVGADALLAAAATACGMLDDDDEARRDEARAFVDRIAPHEQFRRVLLRALDSAESPALLRSLAPLAIPIVLELLNGSISARRRRALTALIEQVDPIIVCRAVAALARRAPCALMEFAQYFDRLTAEAAVRLLGPLLSAPQVTLRRTALDILVRPGIVVPMHTIECTLRDDDAGVQAAALRLMLMQPSHPRLNLTFRLLTGQLLRRPPTRTQTAAVARALLVSETADDLKCLAEALIVTAGDVAAIRAGVPKMIAGALAPYRDVSACRVALRRWRFSLARLRSLRSGRRG